MKQEQQFEPTPASVAQARRFVVGALVGVARDRQEVISVMVSELVTNAVRHGATPFVVQVDQTGGRVRVEVTDDGDGVPTLQAPAPSELSGRGLRIVAALCDDWGVSKVDRHPGKTVWFTVEVGETRRLQESG